MIKRIIILFMLLIPIFSIYSTISFVEKGFFDVNKVEKNDITTYSMKDNKGHSVIAAIAKGTSSEQLDSFFTLHSLIKKWSIINYTSITFIIDRSNISFTIYPIDITYKNTDLLQYIPSTLYFSQIREIVEYDFRMNIGTTSPKIQGTYTGEVALLEAMLAAIPSIKNEETTSPDKDYLFLQYKIEALEKQFEFLDTNKALKGEVQILTKTLNQTNKENEEEQSELKREIEELRKEIATLSLALSSATESILQLRKEQSEGEEDLDNLKKAIITLHNVGVFGNIRSINPLIIDRVISLKEEDPKITQQETKKILTRDTYNPTDHELFLIFALFFNEYL